MAELYPGVCREGSYILVHTLPGDKCIYIGVGINSGSFTSKGFPRTYTASEQKWIPTFFVVWLNLKRKPPCWVSVGNIECTKWQKYQNQKSMANTSSPTTKSITFPVYRIFYNAKDALREAAKAEGFAYAPNWTTRQFGKKICQQFGDGIKYQVGNYFFNILI